MPKEQEQRTVREQGMFTPSEWKMIEKAMKKAGYRYKSQFIAEHVVQAAVKILESK